MRVMRVLVLTVMATGMCLAAVKAKDAAKKHDAGKPAKSQALTLPKEAVRVEQFAYRYKDPEGKVWIYRETPFGLVRLEEKEEAPADAKAAKPMETEVEAVADGDQIRFERPGPFGKWKWTRKKTDTLSVEERDAWERAQKSSKDSAKNAKE